MGSSASTTSRPTAAFVVHSLAHALDAARGAAAAARPAALRSAPGAAGYAGCGWFLGVVAEARRAVPDARVAGLLDCGGDAALALEAIEAGAEWILLDAAPDAAAQVSAAARAAGARINDAPARTLDLRRAADGADACRAFLEAADGGAAGTGQPAPAGITRMAGLDGRGGGERDADH